jgi:hypothetical protein
VRSTLLSLLALGLVCNGVASQEPIGSYLCQPAYVLDDAYRLPMELYTPQPGDIMLTTDKKLIFEVTFRMAFTGHPHHSGIVAARSDGRMAVLESGPHDTLKVELLDALPHLRSYEAYGQVWIRKRRTPLTAAQSATLTRWSERQEKRWFAGLRLCGQLTPFRCRGPIRTQFVGGPHGERSSYFCCELLMESCVAAGLVDPVTTRPSATFPSDVFYDKSVNRWVNQHLNMGADWYPPQRWSSTPIARAPSLGAPIPTN